MSAIDFAYDRLGQYILPGLNKLAWLSVKGRHPIEGKGDLSFGISPKNMFLITEEEVVMLSPAIPRWVGGVKPDHVSFFLSGDAEEHFGPGSSAKFMGHVALNPPDGKFVLFSLGRANFPSSHLILNVNKKTVRYADPKVVYTFRADIILGAESVLIDAGIKKSEYWKVIDVVAKRISGQDLSEKEVEYFTVLTPQVRAAVVSLYRNECVDSFKSYISGKVKK